VGSSYVSGNFSFVSSQYAEHHKNRVRRN
jgi:hypothetical protein